MTEPIVPATVSISLTVKDGKKALDFYAAAFEAEETMRMETPEGGIGHAEFRIGNTKIFLSEEYAEYHAFAMKDGDEASCLFSLEVSDCDATTERAVTAGATVIREPKDEFWGARGSILLDPFGYRWGPFHVTEVLTQEEAIERAKSAT